MSKRFVLFVIFVSFCLAGCVKSVKMNPIEGNVVSFRSVPFEIQVAEQLYYINGGERLGKTGVDKITWGGGVRHEWRNCDSSAYLYITHLHKDSKMRWLTTANGEGRELLFIDGVKFWHKKEKVVLQNGNSYWEELWLYSAGSDRIYIQVVSRDENVSFDVVKFNSVDAL